MLKVATVDLRELMKRSLRSSLVFSSILGALALSPGCSSESGDSQSSSAAELGEKPAAESELFKNQEPLCLTLKASFDKVFKDAHIGGYPNGEEPVKASFPLTIQYTDATGTTFSTEATGCGRMWKSRRLSCRPMPSRA